MIQNCAYCSTQGYLTAIASDLILNKTLFLLYHFQRKINISSNINCCKSVGEVDFRCNILKFLWIMFIISSVCRVKIININFIEEE